MNQYDNNLDASEHYHEIEYGEGGVAKAKEIIMKKIGLNEENADFIVSQSEKFAIWLADSIVKANMTIVEGTTKKEAVDMLNKSPNTIKFLRTRIRGILDWLQHPVTPKQNLRELSFAEAEVKAKEWHDELQVLGGDIDFVEPEINIIIKEYPIDSDGVKYYWAFIPSNYCDLESSRMGHCGRTGYGNTLISLRSVKPYGKGHTLSDSHVTIAYGNDKSFYQVKGKKNQKPTEKYQPYIFDLIKSLLNNEINESINKKIENINSEIKIKKDELSKDKQKITTDYIVRLSFDIDRLKKELDALDIDFNFTGFGSEYASSEDYGWEDMTKEQIKELYELYPNLFNDFASQYMLFNAGLSNEEPNTTIIIEKSPDSVSDLLRLDTDLSDDVVEKVLIGETNDWFNGSDTWNYYYDNASDYVDDLNNENKEEVINKIVEITGVKKSIVEENGVKYYLAGNDEDFDSDDFDDINRAIASALRNAEEDSYVDYYYEQIEDSLSELGTIKKLNQEGLKIEINLSQFMSIGAISSYLKELGTDSLEDVFFEAERNGDIELPKLYIDDRYSASPSIEAINEYFDIENYARGGNITKLNKMNKYNNLDASEHYHEIEYGEGGVAKAKEIIMKKIGLNEENADYLVSQSEKFAIWLADSIVKKEMLKLDFNKKDTIEFINKRNNHIQYNYSTPIREVLDWLQHPVTPKQELKTLSFDEALVKSKQWHDELQVLGGDIDFVEPERNIIIKEYPIDSDGIEYYWVDIPSNYCELESSRMGHCGRTGYGNTLISLRSIKPYGKGHTLSDSHVTIAYDGYVFRQVKGKKNQKPAEKYQPYIFDLIKSILNDELKESMNKKIENINSKIEDNKEEMNILAKEISLADVDSLEFKQKTDALNLLIDKESEWIKIKSDIPLNYFYFEGFGSEYASEEDYGFEDMTEEQLRELYDINPKSFNDAESVLAIYDAGIITDLELQEQYTPNSSNSIFASFGNQIKLYERGVILNKPSTIVNVRRGCRYVSDLLDVDRNTSEDLVANILCGDLGEFTDSFNYYYDNSSDLVNNLNKENEEIVINEIAIITGLEKSIVEEYGINYYLDGENEDSDEDFENIKRALSFAQSSADENDYNKYLRRELESSLEEYGKIISLNDDGVEIEVDLLDFIDEKDIDNLMEDLGTNDLEDVFDEAISNGIIDKKSFSIDYNYNADGSFEDFNANFDIRNYAKGGGVGNLTFEEWLNKNNIKFYKRTYYWVADDGGSDYLYIGTKNDVMKSLKSDWKSSFSNYAKGGEIVDTLYNNLVNYAKEQKYKKHEKYFLETIKMYFKKDRDWEKHPMENENIELNEFMDYVVEMDNDEHLKYIIITIEKFKKKYGYTEEDLYANGGGIMEYKEDKDLIAVFDKKHYNDTPFGGYYDYSVIFVDKIDDEYIIFEGVRNDLSVYVPSRLKMPFNSIINFEQLTELGKFKNKIDAISKAKEYAENEKFADGGSVESKVNELYAKSNFINDDFNWKNKLLEMFQDRSIEAYNIYESLNKKQKEEVLQELYSMDNDMGSYGDEDIETSKENLSILLDGAKKGKKYAKGGGVGMKFYVIDAKDGKILSKGFDTEEEAKVEKFEIFEKTKNFFLTQKEMNIDLKNKDEYADGGYVEKLYKSKFSYIIRKENNLFVIYFTYLENLNYFGVKQGFSTKEEAIKYAKKELERISEKVKKDNTYFYRIIRNTVYENKPTGRVLELGDFKYKSEAEKYIGKRINMRMKQDNQKAFTHFKFNDGGGVDGRTGARLDNIKTFRVTKEDTNEKVVYTKDYDTLEEALNDSYTPHKEGGMSWVRGYDKDDNFIQVFDKRSHWGDYKKSFSNGGGVDAILKNYDNENDLINDALQYLNNEFSVNFNINDFELYESYRNANVYKTKNTQDIKSKVKKVILIGGRDAGGMNFKSYDGFELSINKNYLWGDSKMSAMIFMANFDKNEINTQSILTFPKYKGSLGEIRGGLSFSRDGKRIYGYAKGGGVDDEDWIEESLINLQDKVNNDNLIVDNSDSTSYTATNGSDEYLVFKTEEDARERAIERVKEDLEENPQYFSKNWLAGYVDGESFFTEIYNEWNEGYVNDIESENSDEYETRLIEELIENGIISSEELKEDGFNAEDYKDDYVKLITSNQIEEGNGGLDHYISNFGEEKAFKVVLENNLINIEDASENAVNTDGIAHFISFYDEKQLDLSNGHVAYRIN